jgi:hypothetical protein
MPNFNGTGPDGMGPMGGKGRGGRGRGLRSQNPTTVTPPRAKTEANQNLLQEEIDNLKNRIVELEAMLKSAKKAKPD